MSTKTFNPARVYPAALRLHLKGGRNAALASARRLVMRAMAAGMSTLDLAKLHEQTLLAQILPKVAVRRRAAVIRRAALFFASAIIPAGQSGGSAVDGMAQLDAMIKTLSQRTVELAVSNRELSQQISQRQTAEASLAASERRYRELLSRAEGQRAQVRRLAHELLSVQEDERKKISRDLHDVVAQTLTGISLRLVALKHEAEINTKDLQRNINRTQKLVQRAVDSVHQFARELRPALLDDLGLLPALQAFLKAMTASTGIRTTLRAAADVEQLDMSKRTVLFRVAQEALANVAKHAKASLAIVCIQKDATGNGGYIMTIVDDGRSFDVQGALRARGGKRLGLLGMRERLAMVGGQFEVESVPGKGTTVTARVPLRKAALRAAAAG